MTATLSISSPFIKRPVATSLLAVAIMMCGWLGFRALPIAALPQVEFPTIEIITRYPGANPDTMASLITAPLERQFGQIPSLVGLSSQSSYGFSRITLQFDLGRDIDAAAQDVQSAINAAAGNIPRSLPYPPVYSKINPADQPIVTLTLSSTTIPLRKLSDLADTILAPKLSEISGVGRVSIEGGIRPAVRIMLDLDRLASYKIGVEDIRTAIAAANTSTPKGSLDGLQQSYTIATNDQIGTADAYNNVVIANRNGANVFLHDIAEVQDGLENDKVAATYQSEAAVILDIRRQPGANVVETADVVKAALPKLRRTLPTGVSFDIVQDRTETIRASIRDVSITLIVSIILVVGVVLLFLRSARATFIAGTTLPLSIVASFGVMWFAGFSLNNLSLMALTIGTGFIVDDAIVMIENIARHIEEGESPFEAAMKGASEIGFTVVSLTVSLIAVFIPLLFMTGLVGRMFREFALTLSIAVVVSALISLTLTPMMCAYILRSGASYSQKRWIMIVERPFSALEKFYQRTLGWTLERSKLMLGLTVTAMALTAALYIKIPKGFLPEQDTSLINLVLEASPDVSFKEMQRLENEVSSALRADPAVRAVVGVLGIGSQNATLNSAHLLVTLVPQDQRHEKATNIAERLTHFKHQIKGVRLFAEAVQDIEIATHKSKSRYQYTLAGADPELVAEWGDKLLKAFNSNPHITHLATETPGGGLRTFINIDREKAGRLGISMQLINDTLNDAFGQRQISTIYAQSNQYRVVMQASPKDQTDPSILNKLYISTNGGTQIPLSSVAQLSRDTFPLVIAHEQQFPAYTISFDLDLNTSLDQAIRAIADVENSIGLPSLLVGSFAADAAEFQKVLASEVWLILAAIVVIYLVLGMLYESYLHPITILSTLPSAGVGALLALSITGNDLSIIALIGIILLMGIVKKNAIMMIDFAISAERTSAITPKDAIIEACRLRFRPIMMTTLAALFGALPLAFAQGAGSEFRVPLGVTVIGGLLLSQILTLYTTPTIFLALEQIFSRKVKM
jgi:multidrug efflux pump